MQCINFTVQHGFDGFDIIQNTVISALGDRQYPGFGFYPAGKRVGVDFTLYIFGLEFIERNRPDNTVVITGRHQEHRDRAGHNYGMQYRFMAVPVNHDDIIRCDRRVPDDFIGGRGAIGDEEQMIRAKNSCCVAFGSRHRAGMVKQLTQLFYRIANVCAEHILTKKLVEHLPYRAFQESHPAGMTRTVPGIGSIRGIMRQGAKKWRRQ